MSVKDTNQQAQSPASDYDRVAELEIRNAYQDQAYKELSDQVFAHEQRLSRVEDLVRQLAGKLKEVAADKPEAQMPDERPPHY